MPASAATVFPSPSTAYRLYGRILSATTGDEITGGLTGLAAVISQDGGTFAAPSNSPTEIATTSGWFYLDLLSTEIGAYSAVCVKVTATNSGAASFGTVLITDGLGQIANAVPSVASIQSGLATAAGLSAAETAIIAAIPTVTSIWNQADYGDSAGRATTVWGQIAQIWRYLLNAQVVNKYAQTQTLMRDNGNSTLVQGYITVNSEQTNKGAMS